MCVRSEVNLGHKLHSRNCASHEITVPCPPSSTVDVGLDCMCISHSHFIVVTPLVIMYDPRLFFILKLNVKG